MVVILLGTKSKISTDQISYLEPGSGKIEILKCPPSQKSSKIEISKFDKLLLVSGA